MRVIPAQGVLGRCAAVVLDPPSDPGQAYEFGDGGPGRQGGQPATGGLVCFGWPFGQQPALREAAIISAGDVAVGGRTWTARKWLVMAAAGGHVWPW